MRFPEKSVHFESTTKLFAKIHQLFGSNGFQAEVALAATHFSFAAWFAEVLPVAPCMLITGSRAEAALLLQLLGCLVRHPLPLGEFTRRGLCSLPMELLPTLLINAGQMKTATLELLRTSNHRNAFLPWKDGLIDPFCPKAMYCGDTVDNAIFGESMLHISLAPSRGRLPILDEKYIEDLSQEYQAQFLAYRSRYIMAVRESHFDLPEFTSTTRILARVLGAPIVDAPALQAGLTRLLRDYEGKKLELLWTDLRCVVLEAVLHHCHKEPGEWVLVGKITETVNGILKGRGEATKREAREIGPHLKALRLIKRRRGSGYAILLDSAVCCHIHGLAHGFGLLAVRAGEARCEQCELLVNGINARDGRASESEKRH